ncbi:MAG: hypothetical protein MI749_15920, partial [Desulfovibrionales bacterium]|nr:hypothetical protein [Desulfovibrionales bacterium]
FGDMQEWHELDKEALERGIPFMDVLVVVGGACLVWVDYWFLPFLIRSNNSIRDIGFKPG